MASSSKGSPAAGCPAPVGLGLVGHEDMAGVDLLGLAGAAVCLQQLVDDGLLVDQRVELLLSGCWPQIRVRSSYWPLAGLRLGGLAVSAARWRRPIPLRELPQGSRSIMRSDGVKDPGGWSDWTAGSIDLELVGDQLKLRVTSSRQAVVVISVPFTRATAGPSQSMLAMATDAARRGSGRGPGPGGASVAVAACCLPAVPQQAPDAPPHSAPPPRAAPVSRIASCSCFLSSSLPGRDTRRAAVRGTDGGADLPAVAQGRTPAPR